MDLKDHIVTDWGDDLDLPYDLEPSNINGYLLYCGEGSGGALAAMAEKLCQGPGGVCAGDHDWPFKHGFPATGSPGFCFHWVRINGKDYTVVFPYYTVGPGGWKPTEVWEGLYDLEALIWLSYELILWFEFSEPGNYDYFVNDHDGSECAAIVEWLATH